MSFLSEEDLFDELLGERGATLDRSSGDGHPDGANGAANADTTMGVEITIFDGDNGPPDVLADLVAFCEHAIVAFAAVFPEEDVVTIVVAVGAVGDAGAHGFGADVSDVAAEIEEEAEDSKEEDGQGDGGSF